MTATVRIDVKEDLLVSLRAFFRLVLELEDISALFIPQKLPMQNTVMPVLVTDPEKHVRGLCDFLGLDFHPGMLAIQRANSSYLQVQEEKQQPGIRTVSLDRWRGELTRTELWILEKVCSETMTRFGYAPERVRPGFRDLPDLAVTAFHLPKRLFNMLFRSHKPFTLEKVKRVLGTVNDQGKGSG